MLSLSDLFSGLKTFRKKKDIHLRPARAKASNGAFHQFTMNDISGKPFGFAQLKGKKTLVVNTASECGYTSQYALLEDLYQKHHDKLNIIGIPCNDFGHQEAGSADEIHSFCQRNYGVSFPILEKVVVKEDNRAELYNWLSDKKQNGWCDHIPHWNFCKYLVDEKGELLLFTNPVVEPGDLLKYIAY
jgi:glutathione peroxidase